MAEQELKDFGGYLEQSLRVMEREAPDLFRLLRIRMNKQRVGITVGNDPTIQVSFEQGRPWVRAAATPTEVMVVIPQSELDALLRGDKTVEAAVWSNQLGIRGPIDSVLALLESLTVWFHGAVRCASLPALHARYLVHGDSSASPTRR